MSSDLPTYSVPYTDQSAATFVSKAVKKYDELKDLSDITSLNTLVKTFSSAYFSFKLQRKIMCDIMMKMNYVPITSTILENLVKLGYFLNNEVWFVTYYVYNTLWNFCDFDQEIATAILNTEIPKILIANVLYKPYIDGLSNTNMLYLIKASVSIIHNVARYPGNQGAFNIKELKNVLVTLIKREPSDFLSLISLLALSVLVDETELKLLEEGKNGISVLIGHIKTAQGKPDKRFDGFMIWELVNSLRCISANDNMKKTIVQEGGLEVLIQVLKDPSNDDEIEKSLATIWNLCFDKEIMGNLQSVYDIKNVIKTFEKSLSSSIKKNYNGIIWLLDSKNQSIQRVKSASVSKLKSSKQQEQWKFDMFFSYSWANKPAVFSIRDELLKSKIKIWIDADQMKGSTLEAMADGIENSKIFVMALSEAYRTSPNCRTEAEYAFSLKKHIIPLIMELKYRPTSWLGLIMGSKTYYEFSERRVFQDSINGLLSNIVGLLGDCVEESVVPKYTAPTGLDQTDSVPSRESDQSVVTTRCSSEVNNWSKADVGKWLTKAQLTTLKSKFAEIDGVLLNSMIEISHMAPDYLYQTLKTEFGMKLVDVLRFNAALKDLTLK